MSRTMALSAALLLLAVACHAQAMSREKLVELFVQAKHSFAEGNRLAQEKPEAARQQYLEAALYYETIVRDGGVRNGRLFYNIGNAYFRAGDLGRAILNYRRALLYAPNDPNLRQNLAYARSRRVDVVQVKDQQRVLHTVFFWHYDLSDRIKLILFAVAFGSVWLFAIVKLLTRRSGFVGPMGAAVVLACLLGGSLVADAVSRSGPGTGVVLADEVVARKGDADTYQPSFREPLHAGTEFTVLEQRSQWLHIEVADGSQAWIPASSAGLVREAGS